MVLGDITNTAANKANAIEILTSPFLIGEGELELEVALDAK